MSYSLDSSLDHAKRALNLARAIGDSTLTRRALMKVAFIYNTSGVMYKEAHDIFASIDGSRLNDNDRFDHYCLGVQVYRNLAAHSLDRTLRERYNAAKSAYRDSALTLRPDNDVLLARRHMDAGNWRGALHAMHQSVDADIPSREGAVKYHILSQICALNGDRIGRERYLALSAACDLRNGVREYLSLQELAMMLYQDGDIDRAYRYIHQSINDATACNAKLRMLEMSELLPIIDSAYDASQRESRRYLYATCIVIGVLSVMLTLLLLVSYDIEKYRKGKNAAGFAVQLYWSVDGRNWTSAGEDFYTRFEPDDATEGYAAVPGETVTVSDILPTVLGRGCDLYLAWNISVASGSDAQAAMALAIDNFSISGSLPAIPTANHYIYVEDRTGWDSLGLYAWGDGEIYGAWPGQAVIDEREIDGVTHKVFPLDAESGSFNLIFNNRNNGKQLTDHTITAGKDHYFIIDENGVTPKQITGLDTIGTTLPAIDFDGVTLRVTDASEISVYTLAGIRVAHTTGDNLDLSRLVPGVYIVNAGASIPVTGKIVK